MTTAPHTSDRCGIILAGGEGERLRPFIRQLRGSVLPKQYVNLIGTRSMLEHTFRRTEKLIPPERLFTVVSRNHLSHPEVRRQLSSLQPGKVVVQPVNKDTGAGVLLPLMQVYKRYPQSTAVVFPSDHFIVEEQLFMTHVDLALRIVEQHPTHLVLLVIPPCAPEPEYGYILPGPRANDCAPLAVRRVAHFIEKPDLDVANEIALNGGMWNTMVMAFKVRELLDLIQSVAPPLYYFFERISGALETSSESDVLQEVYRHVEAVNFSKGLLEKFPIERLKVLPVRGVYWSDWGSERRIMSVLQNTGHLGRLHGLLESSLFRIRQGFSSAGRGGRRLLRQVEQA